MELCGDIYRLCAHLPDTEKYGLSSQLKRAAVSVPSNIAEGAARNYEKEFFQFLGVAQGSLAELETQLLLCGTQLNLLEAERIAPVLEKAERVAKMITGLKKNIRQRQR